MHATGRGKKPKEIWGGGERSGSEPGGKDGGGDEGEDMGAGVFFFLVFF